MHGLGELEAAVMDVLWHDGGPLKVRQVLERLDTGKKLAYTTVLTVLDNLHRKNWVTREFEGNAYRYQPRVSRAEAAANALREVLIASGDPEAALLHFAQSATEEESAVLRRALRRKASGR
ncbi:BlaI/MecI/CopY family transcriptional regulator [Saccharothrix coeruleofusca]|uniref:Penicillinase repressor n=1 Tax=Saccharothrix coeruleofusca TaxID=33919 RepID=A0A918ARP1_9PSEU|nr:BlaI/MecI/CopY family transcriptional regulator [Saccharothrix coeruleofusca]MBP2334732.1 putative transcriptional regulator [Saccharothrix coeruleofusca]GGP74574.1 penicillinase repressor [Saccharothrix coeruleofusca]